MNKALVCDIKRFAVHDGGGIRTTIFLKGCPLKCLWCHNPESISQKPQLAYYVHKCIDCGECLLHADFCAELLKKLKKENIHTAVDTCGFVSKEAIDKVMPYTDIFLYDIKAFDEQLHIDCTGKSNAKILENIKYIDANNKRIEIRIPYVPGINDGQIKKIGEYIKELKNVYRVVVLPYHGLAKNKYECLGYTYTCSHIAAPKREDIDAAIKTLKDMGVNAMHNED